MNEPRNMQSSLRRKDWVDFTRAIAMFLVMYGHFNSEMNWFFVAFNPIKIPLFFVVSGYLLDTNKYSFQEFLKTRVIGLIIPYFCLSFIRSVPMIFIAGIRTKGFVIAIRDLLYSVLVGEGLWFIPCLFLTEIIVYIWQRILWEKYSDIFGRNKEAIMHISLITLAVAMMLIINGKESYVWHIDTAIVMAGCIAMGQIYKVKEDIFSKSEMVIAFGIAYLGLIVGHVLINGLATMDPNHNIYCSVIVTVFAMWFGTYAMMGISKKIVNLPKGILFVGRNTLVYYALHTTIKPILEKALTYAFKSSLNMDSFILRQFVFLGVCLLCAVPAVLFNKYLPFCVGKKSGGVK